MNDAVSILTNRLTQGGNITPESARSMAESYVYGAMTGTGIPWTDLQLLFKVHIPPAAQVNVSTQQLTNAAENVARAAGIDVTTNAGKIAVQEISTDVFLAAAKGSNVTAPSFGAAYAASNVAALDDTEVVSKAQSQAAIEFATITKDIAKSTNQSVDQVLNSNPQLATQLSASLLERALDQQQTLVTQGPAAVAATVAAAPVGTARPVVTAGPAAATTPSATQDVVNAVAALSTQLTGSITAGLQALQRNLTSPVEPVVKSPDQGIAGISPMLLLGGLALVLLLRRS